MSNVKRIDLFKSETTKIYSLSKALNEDEDDRMLHQKVFRKEIISRMLKFKVFVLPQESPQWSI